MQAGWAASRQASFKQCTVGFKKRFRLNPLDAADHAQYNRMLAQLAKAKVGSKDNSAVLHFNDMSKGPCQGSTMTLGQDGLPWKVSQFVQGRCFGLKK